MKYTTKQIGDRGERYAVKYLKKHKYKIRARNYQRAFAEIDIIAENKDFLVFVEVKTRKRNSLTKPIDAVNYKKQQKIFKLADLYLSENSVEKQCRFDVCEVYINSDNLRLVGINYMEDAF